MVLPVSLDDAKAHLRRLDNDEDTLIAGYVRNAVEWVESYTGRDLTQRERVERLPSFDADLPGWPISGTAGVAYGAPVATPVVIADVPLRTTRRPARLALPAALSRWPYLPFGGEVVVTYQAGYEDADQIPGTLLQAVIVLAAAFSADREGGSMLKDAIGAATMLCGRKRVRRL